MARLPRLTLAGLPHHVLQRGNNLQTVFADTQDHEKFLTLLIDGARNFRVALHAYVMLDSQFQLLATPSTVDALPLWMQAVGRSYVRYFNDRHGRSGTLWDGRYRSTVLQPDRYVMPAMVWLDEVPVRAGAVAQPAHYPWSSHAHYAGMRSQPGLTPPPAYWALGNTPFEREAAYVSVVHAGLSGQDLARLEDASLRGWVAGDPEFVARMQNQTTRRLSRSKPGRPPIHRLDG